MQCKTEQFALFVEPYNVIPSTHFSNGQVIQERILKGTAFWPTVIKTVYFCSQRAVDLCVFKPFNRFDVQKLPKCRRRFSQIQLDKAYCAKIIVKSRSCRTKQIPVRWLFSCEKSLNDPGVHVVLLVGDTERNLC